MKQRQKDSRSKDGLTNRGRGQDTDRDESTYRSDLRLEFESKLAEVHRKSREEDSSDDQGCRSKKSERKKNSRSKDRASHGEFEDFYYEQQSRSKDKRCSKHEEASDYLRGGDDGKTSEIPSKRHKAKRAESKRSNPLKYELNGREQEFSSQIRSTKDESNKIEEKRWHTEQDKQKKSRKSSPFNNHSQGEDFSEQPESENRRSGTEPDKRAREASEVSFRIARKKSRSFHKQSEGNGNINSDRNANDLRFRARELNNVPDPRSTLCKRTDAMLGVMDTRMDLAGTDEYVHESPKALKLVTYIAATISLIECLFGLICGAVLLVDHKSQKLYGYKVPLVYTYMALHCLALISSALLILGNKKCILDCFIIWIGVQVSTGFIFIVGTAAYVLLELEEVSVEQAVVGTQVISFVFFSDAFLSLIILKMLTVPVVLLRYLRITWVPKPIRQIAGPEGADFPRFGAPSIPASRRSTHLSRHLDEESPSPIPLRSNASGRAERQRSRPAELPSASRERGRSPDETQRSKAAQRGEARSRPPWTSPPPSPNQDSSADESIESTGSSASVSPVISIIPRIAPASNAGARRSGEFLYSRKSPATPPETHFAGKSATVHKRVESSPSTLYSAARPIPQETRRNRSRIIQDEVLPQLASKNSVVAPSKYLPPGAVPAVGSPEEWQKAHNLYGYGMPRAKNRIVRKQEQVEPEPDY